MAEFLPLADALATNRLQGFIAQAEADGFGVVDRSQFDTLLGTAQGTYQKVKHPVHPFAV